MCQSYKTLYTSGGTVNNIVNGGVCNIHNQVNNTYYGVAPAMSSNPNPVHMHTQGPEASSEAGISRSSRQQGSSAHVVSESLVIDEGSVCHPIYSLRIDRFVVKYRDSRGAPAADAVDCCG
ncbi:hypothetical protein FIBSPDRAFT_936456 [Athelia psychrophila]|uniref:Uncharacterized protein n=1 Tax=Athelia psychrophila TaxID=1759441 RepID=A0A166C145_9AGAM|nr:hypothetical protein FIBSPDRAFT_936456 [Fibularhizoctonia sp. CBS 109695]